LNIELSKLKLVTMIADDSLAHILEEQITALGANGYTVSKVEGKGKTGSLNSAWLGENVKIETIVSEDTCEQIINK
jgi:nitrogen regulatory protein PII